MCGSQRVIRRMAPDRPCASGRARLQQTLGEPEGTSCTSTRPATSSRFSTNRHGRAAHGQRKYSVLFPPTAKARRRTPSRLQRARRSSSGANLVRGFKVHGGVVDPLATPLVAQSIDIETAQYSGAISAPSSAGSLTRDFARPATITSQGGVHLRTNTANGSDAGGNPIGVQVVELRLSHAAHQRSGCGGRFRSPHCASVNFADVGAVPSYGVSYSIWGDPAIGRWPRRRASCSVQTPLGTVATGPCGACLHHEHPGRLDAGDGRGEHRAGSATLVYQ